MDNKKIVITGASSGIGLATAKVIAEQGGRVVLIARNEANLVSLYQTLPGAGHEYYAADVNDETRMKAVVTESYNQSGAFDGFIHCAGLHQLRPLAATKVENINEVMAVNVTSLFMLTKLLTKKLNKEGASIVFLSSTAAIRGTAAASVYSASKGAVTAATKSLAVELAPRNIRVNTLLPGVVETPMSEHFLGSLPQQQREALVEAHLLGLGQPQDVAYAAAFLLSDHARWITGTELVIDGGLTCK